MKSLRQFFTFFKPYEWFLLITIITLNIVVSVLTGEPELLSSVAAISGVLCVVLVAKGHISNYLFGLIQTSLYAYVSFGVGYWGEVALNALYYVPMQFIGFYLWRKRRMEGSKTQVKSRNLNLSQRIWLYSICAVAVALCAWLLERYHDPAPLLDSITTVLSVVAMFLMVRTYSDQWYLWIIVNVCTITMWVMAALRGEPNAWVISTMWMVYLLNSLNGLVQWRRKALNPTKVW